MTNQQGAPEVPEVRSADYEAGWKDGYKQGAWASEAPQELREVFTAADMATASAQGFRDGVASLAANAREPVAHLWQHCETGITRIVMPDTIVDANASWQVVGPLYLGTAPPTAQAEGWRPIETAPKGECVLLWSEITRDEPLIGDWAEYARYNHPQFTHWSRWDGLPPTSAEGVEHG